MDQNQTLNSPRFMREVVLPQLTEHLNAAALASISRAENAANQALVEIRKSAYMALQKLGLPNSHSEDFTFIRVNEFLPFLNAELGSVAQAEPQKSNLTHDLFSTYLFPESQSNHLVLVNGIFASELSQIDSNIQVTVLSDKPTSKSPLSSSINAETLQSILNAINEETDASSAMAFLFAAEPLVISIPPGYQSPSPLQILYLQSHTLSQDESKLQHSATFILAEKNSEVKILVRHENIPAASPLPRMHNQSTLAIIEENAGVKIFESAATDENIHFHKLTGRVKRNARLATLTAHTGSKLTRQSYAIDLMGENAEAEIKGATVLIGNRQTHQHIQIRHLVPHCNSRQHFKSVAADDSRSSVDGTIVVAENAIGTNAHQLINNLMLSDTARTDSKPQLKIYADDVKCAHGSTTGKLDAAQQFYLESRGLTPVIAKTALTIAFVSEILEKCGDDLPHFRTHLEHRLLDVLKLKLPTYTGVSDGN